MTVIPSFVAVVLTGGRSRRMGRDKAMLEIDGVPMVDRVITVLRRAGAVEVATLGGAARGRADRHLADRHPGEGPLGGVITALAEFPARTVVVVACDLAWLDEASVAAVVRAGADADVALARTDRLESLLGAWKSTALSVLEAEFVSGERSIRNALGALRVVEVPVSPEAVRNVNRPEDVPDRGE